MTENCDVCLETLKKTGVHKQFECINSECTFNACIQCHFKYLLDSMRGLHCMSCKFGWIHDHVASQVPKIWMKRYDDSRVKIEVDSAIAMIPEIQTTHANKIQTNILSKKLNKLKTEAQVLLKEKYSNIKKESYDDADYATIAPIARRVFDLKYNLIPSIKKELRRIKRATVDEKSRNRSTRNVKIICGCPCDNCRGYIKTDTHRCGVCNTQICSSCHVEISDNLNTKHTCQSEDVETAKMILRDTKPCIKCNTLIYKIDGCDQMWCTICHTAFSWNTGKEEFKIHNPHAYQYYRENNIVIPREAENVVDNEEQGEGGCQEQISFRMIQTKFLPNQPPSWVFDFIMSRTHIQMVTIEKLTAVVNCRRAATESDVVTYICNDIDKNELKRRIVRKGNTIDRATRLRDIFSTYLEVTNDIMKRLNIDNDSEIKKETDQCIEYFNKEFRKVDKETGIFDKYRTLYRVVEYRFPNIESLVSF